MTTARETFDRLLPAALESAPRKAREIEAVFRFEIGGPRGGVWTADFLADPPRCTPGGDPEAAGCTIQVCDEGFERLTEGDEEVAIQMLMDRELVVSGDQMLAVKLQQLFALTGDGRAQVAPEPALAQMNPARRFIAYARGFEEAFRSRDWGSLARFFTEDAVYDSNPGPVFGGERRGWPAIEAHYADIMERWDRRFERDGHFVSGPEVVALSDVPNGAGLEADDVCRMQWHATYRVEGAPMLTVPGTEWALYRGGRIFLLRDRISEETHRAIAGWLADHGHRIGWPD